MKEKAGKSHLDEYENKIYASQGNASPLLNKGEDTFKLMERHFNNYQTIISENNEDIVGDFRFDNLVKVMLVGLPSTDWMPPLLNYFNKFKGVGLYDFLVKLDNKFSADWIKGTTPTQRISEICWIA